MAPQILSKSEVGEVVAASSGLSKADSKKALDGFINATTNALAGEGTVYCWGSARMGGDPDSDGDGISDGTEFGVFSTVDTGVSSSGCPLGKDVVFQPGTAFTAQDASQQERCERPVKGAVDAGLRAAMEKTTGLSKEEVTLAYDTILSTIVEVVNAGGIVDLDGFGRFAAETTVTATVTENKPRRPLAVDVWEYSISGSGGSEGDIDQITKALSSISKRSARTGRNPHRGKEVKMTTTNTVKFKAGAELSKSVN